MTWRLLRRRACGTRIPTVLQVALAFALGVVGTLQAADFTVSPTRVELGERAATQTLTLGNPGARALGFEVEAQLWTQDGRGEWVLAPAPELVVHPRLLQIEPGARASLRVGFIDAPPASERAYRIHVSQLPDPAGAPDGAVQMLTRVSLPVFVQARPGQPAVALDSARWVGDRLQLEWRNTGNRHQPPTPGVLRILDASGGEVARVERTLGYVLAGAALVIEQDGLGSACRAGVTAEFVSQELDAPLRIDMSSAPRACAD